MTDNIAKIIADNCLRPHLTKQDIRRIREILATNDRAIPIICLPPKTRDDVIWAVRHPNRKRTPNVIELRHEFTAEEAEEIIRSIERHRGQ